MRVWPISIATQAEFVIHKPIVARPLARTQGVRVTRFVRRMENVLSRPSAKIMEIVWEVVSASAGVHVLTAVKTVGPAPEPGSVRTMDCVNSLMSVFETWIVTMACCA